jgi:hypothetical protein
MNVLFDKVNYFSRGSSKVGKKILFFIWICGGITFYLAWGINLGKGDLVLL